MIYRLVQPIAKLVSILTFKIEIIGNERIPSGSVIIAANHTSNYDPIILAGMIKRDIHFMAKKELFNHRLTNWFLRRLHAIPVDRNSGIVIRPVRQGLALIQRGGVLGIFPEGKRCKSGETVHPKKGVSFFGCKTGAPILPVAIVKKSEGRRRTLVKIIVGDPIYTSHFPGSDYDFWSRLVMERIHENEEHTEL